MAPVITPWQAGQELLCSAGLGMLVGLLRLVWPVKGRAAFWPDFLAVGLALLLLQSYAASASYAGGVRWYMAAGAALGAAAVQAALGELAAAWMRGIRRALGWPMRLAAQWVLRPARKACLRRQEQAKGRRAEKRMAKDEKKILKKEHRLLYNSNV